MKNIVPKYHEHLTDEQEECLRGCSQQSQYNIMRKHFENGTCPLCEIDQSVNRVLFEHERWLGWETPNKCTTRQSTLDFQLLFFPKEHIRFNELTREHHTDLFDINKWVERNYPQIGGGVVGRYGDMRWNVGTVPGHFHWNWFEPNREGSVIIPLAKDQEWIEKDTNNMIIFMNDYNSRLCK